MVRLNLPAVFLIVVVSTVVLSAEITKTPFHGDESGWISSGYYYTNLLLCHDFDREKWECPQCRTWGSLNPHVGQWIIGLFLKSFPPENGSDFFHIYNYKESAAQNLKAGRIPPPQVLFRARVISAAFGVASCVLMFAIGYWSSGLLAGCLVTVLLICNRLFIGLSTRAMTDVFYNCFLLCGCLIGVFWLRCSRQRSCLLISCACGCATGIAASVKTAGVLIGGLHLLFLIAYRTHTCALKTRCGLAHAAAFLCSALAVIYLLNPYFWPSLEELTWPALVRQGKSLCNELVSPTARGLPIRESPSDKDLGGIVEFPYMFLRWNCLANSRIDHRDVWRKHRMSILHRKLFMDHATFRLEFGVLLVALSIIVRRIIAGLRNRQVTVSAAPALFLLANYLFVIGLLEADWERYFLPAVTAIQIVVGIGAAEAILAAHKALCARRLISKKVGETT